MILEDYSCGKRKCFDC